MLIIGNYTEALVGDPSVATNKYWLTPEQVESNARDAYLETSQQGHRHRQGGGPLNGEWFSRFTFLDVKGLMSKITVQRMLEPR